mgnify:CR=1 FL=1
MEVTFSNGSITSVEVVDSNETKTWADSALHYIPKYIHDEQSLNVDTITGATVTSNAIISAVEKTIKDAHGDVSEWKVNEKVEHKKLKRIVMLLSQAADYLAWLQHCVFSSLAINVFW